MSGDSEAARGWKRSGSGLRIYEAVSGIRGTGAGVSSRSVSPVA